MKLLKEIHKKESGQALILAVILMFLVILIIAPLLAFMGTGIIVGQVFEEKMNEVYAADAGVEDAIYNIITPTAPYYHDLQGLDETASLPSYTLTDVNGETVTVTVTKLSLLQGLLGEDEYKLNRRHAEWMNFELPSAEIVRDYDEGWVEYTAHIILDFTGEGNAKLESIGAFFTPLPGSDEGSVDGPYGYIGTETGVMDFAFLEGGSPETKFPSGGFAFIWRFEKNKIVFKNNSGGFSFKFKVYDPDWEPSMFFIFATVFRMDISYVSSGAFSRWLIEATAEETTVRSAVLEDVGLVILTWEINPPG